MTDQELEKKLTNATAEFDAYFRAKGNPDWKKGSGMYLPDIYYCSDNGYYYQYWPAFCAAEANMSRWQILGHNFDAAVKGLKFYGVRTASV